MTDYNDIAVGGACGAVISFIAALLCKFIGVDSVPVWIRVWIILAFATSLIMVFVWFNVNLWKWEMALMRKWFPNVYCKEKQP